jgi:hypothetical protein
MKRSIKVQELTDRLNEALRQWKDSKGVDDPGDKEPKKQARDANGRFMKKEAHVDTAEGKDHTTLTVMDGDGKVMEQVQDPTAEEFNEMMTEKWDDKRPCAMPAGEITVDLGHVITDGDDVVDLSDEAKEWVDRDCSNDAEESRAAEDHYDRSGFKSGINKVRENLMEEKFKKDPVKLAGLKKALGLNTDKTKEDYEYVNHPKHYNNYDVEVIDMMERIFGAIATYDFCKLNAFKYRMRAGTKPNIDVQQDLDKEQWYLKKAEELKDKMGRYNKLEANALL